MKLTTLLIVTAMNIVFSKASREAKKEEVAGEIGYMTLFKSNIEEPDNVCFNVSKTLPHARELTSYHAVGMFEHEKGRLKAF